MSSLAAQRSSPEISVLIPAHNYAHFLDSCLASVYAQRGVSCEIIVVNDGSTDSTPEVLARYADRITHIKQERAGVSVARNHALRRCSGRYVQLLDADDLLGDPECLLRRVRLLEQLPPKSIAVCEADTFSGLDPTGRPEVNGRWHLCTDKLDLHLCRLNLGPPHAFLFRRTLIDDIGLFKEDWGGCEDYDFWLRALGQGYHFHYCGNTRVLYRRHDGSKAAAKARNGAFPFDVKVHTQMHVGAYGDGVSSMLRTTPGKLAMASGSLASALKISAQANASGRLHLAALASTYLTSALDDGLQAPEKITFETRLYVRRLLCHRRAAASLQCPSLNSALARLSDEALKPMRIAADILGAFPFSTYQQQAVLSCLLKSLKA